MTYINEEQFQKYQHRARHERSLMFYHIAVVLISSIKGILFDAPTRLIRTSL